MTTLAQLIQGGLTLYAMNQAVNKKKLGEIDIYKQRTMDGLSQDTQSIIELITFSDSTKPVGSFKYKVHQYPGDIDIFEPVKVCCSKEQALKKIIAELQSIARRVKKSKTVFWGDFKAGLDLNYVPNENETGEQYSKRTGITLTKEEKANPAAWHDKVRQYYILRWTADDIIRGSVRTPKGGSSVSLTDAIKHDTLIKLDLWAPVNGNYTEVTNFYLFVWKDEQGEEHIINAELGDRLESLNHDIEKYSSRAHWNPLKLSKRLWNKALYQRDRRMTEVLYPLFSSGAARLNQIAGECETLALMYEKVPTTELQSVERAIDAQISGFKRRINDVEDIDVKPDIYKLIDRILKLEGKSRPGLLNQLESQLEKYVTVYSEVWMKDQGLI